MGLLLNHKRRLNMLSTNFTEKLLNLQDVIINNIEMNDKSINIFIKMPIKSHNCPNCKAETKRVHSYRKQVIKDIPAFGKSLFLIYTKRRYRCPHCGKCFYEDNTFLPRYHRMTNRLAAFVIDMLHSERSFKSVANEVNLSVPTVIRIFDMVNYPKPTLSTVLSIDEFKGNTGREKYNCIITDPENHVVLDILPTRYSRNLVRYFKDMNRDEVAYFVSDMWSPYRDLATVFFTNAIQIVDKYHWIRQVVWAFENVRKEEQKKFNKTHRLYFKRSKSLLIKRFDKLTDEQKQQVNVMLYASSNLSTAYFLKEQFYKILNLEDINQAKKLLSDWILDAQSSGLTQFIKCSKTMINWSKGIINSLQVPYTNGFTEGCNNKIKVLKRNAYGYRNFNRFRNRILHMFSYQKLRLKKVVA